MFLTETWLGTDGATLIETSPPNYCFVQESRTEKKAGGTATILSAPLGFKHITFENYMSFEYHTFIFNSPPILCVCLQATKYQILSQISLSCCLLSTPIMTKLLL